MVGHQDGNAANGRPEEPKIDRQLTLHLRGDWGTANLHRVCGWVAQELTDRAGPGTRIATWNSRGFSDAVRAVGHGEVDIALTTPTAFATAALDGRGVYSDEAFPQLRTLGVIPQRDRLVMAVHKSLDVTSFAELRESAPRLRLATSVRDGVNHVGLAAQELLERAGIDVLGWGGQFLEDERPFESLDHVLAGRANAIIHEAVMLPHWQEFAPDYRFLEVEEDVLTALHADYGWPAATVADGYFPGAGGFRTLDFSDFLMVTTSDLDEDVAYAVAWVLGETRHIIEGQYRHLPPERSPITYPLDPPTMGRSPIPLHPGAERYYQALPTD
ncbi:TAXI family TRAP transporter solute-binding subunit [Nocardiopsis terrae]